MNEDKLRVVNENGQEAYATVIDIFKLDKYPNKEYIVYTFGELVSNENERVYISILEETDDSANLKTIEDQQEWVDVQNAMNEIIAEWAQGGGEDADI